MLNLLLITFMFLLVCAPVPMMLFGGDMPEDIKEAEPQPLNFDDLGQSFISLFIVRSPVFVTSYAYGSLLTHVFKGFSSHVLHIIIHRF